MGLHGTHLALSWISSHDRSQDQESSVSHIIKRIMQKLTVCTRKRAFETQHKLYKYFQREDYVVVLISFYNLTISSILLTVLMTVLESILVTPLSSNICASSVFINSTFISAGRLILYGLKHLMLLIAFFIPS